MIGMRHTGRQGSEGINSGEIKKKSLQLDV
jgi:hypothetical protein